MTDPQTEAQAIIEPFLGPIGIMPDEEDEIVSAIATALAAKDAELAVARRNFEELAELQKASFRRAERAEAQLAEANKALEPFAGIADTEDAVGRDDPDDDRVWVVQAHGCQIGDLTIEDFRAARRARAIASGGKQ